MRIISDKYTIELTYNELLLIYESMLKMAEEAIMNNKEWSAEQDMQLIEISFMLGKGDEYRRTIQRFFDNKAKKKQSNEELQNYKTNDYEQRTRN